MYISDDKKLSASKLKFGDVIYNLGDECIWVYFGKGVINKNRKETMKKVYYKVNKFSFDVKAKNGIACLDIYDDLINIMLNRLFDSDIYVENISFGNTAIANPYYICNMESVCADFKKKWNRFRFIEGDKYGGKFPQLIDEEKEKKVVKNRKAMTDVVPFEKMEEGYRVGASAPEKKTHGLACGLLQFIEQ